MPNEARDTKEILGFLRKIPEFLRKIPEFLRKIPGFAKKSQQHHLVRAWSGVERWGFHTNILTPAVNNYRLVFHRCTAEQRFYFREMWASFFWLKYMQGEYSPKACLERNMQESTLFWIWYLVNLLLVGEMTLHSIIVVGGDVYGIGCN